MRPTFTIIAGAALLTGDALWLLNFPGSLSSRLFAPLFGLNIVGAVVAITSAIIPSGRSRTAVVALAFTLLFASGLGFLVVGIFGSFAVALIVVWLDHETRERMSLLLFLPILGLGSMLLSILLAVLLRRVPLSAQRNEGEHHIS